MLFLELGEDERVDRVLGPVRHGRIDGLEREHSRAA